MTSPRISISVRLAAATCYLIGGVFSPAAGAEVGLAASRIRDGLEALYDFRSGGGDVVHDRSGKEPALDLAIPDPSAVRWTTEGLEILTETLILSQTATRLSQAVKQSSEVTVEAWVRPAQVEQSGPARIVTLSRNSNERNFTLGQDGDRLEVRLRTTETSVNGVPALTSPSRILTTRPIQIVYTRTRDGAAALYVDGEPLVRRTVGGEATNWKASFRLGLANEMSGGRPWRGTYRMAAVYSRALTAPEIEQNFLAMTGNHASTAASDSATELFERRIAPVLAANCLECHDAATQEGGLDLTRRESALAGGDSGPAIAPGEPSDSLLWSMVDSDEMPHDRPPLSLGEKKELLTWLSAGATWSLARIDPALYLHGTESPQSFVKRLTVPEYIETVRSTLGVDVSAKAMELLPPDVRADGFSNTAYNLNIDFAHVDAYARLAGTIVDQVNVGRLAEQYTKSRELTDENLTKIIKPVGKRLLRGPLSADELATYCGVSTSVAGGGGSFEDAVRFILEAMLQSPRFIYRMENQRGDGAAWPVNDYELASRLSYLLWGGPPDEQLLRAADQGGLDREGVAKQVERMLASSRAIDQSRRFISEWLNLERLDDIQPDAKRFPNWEPRLADDMKRETLAFFEHVAWTENRPLSDLLNARVSFLTPRLAIHYGLSVDDSADIDEFSRYDLTDAPGRAGLLTQGSVLTIGGDGASTVTRGLFVMHELLRGVVRDPPPGVDTTPIPPEPGLTRRSIAETRMANASCAGCHVKFEPLAFALERFDGLGAYAEVDEFGNALRQDGTIRFPGQPAAVDYDSTVELMDLLAGSGRVRQSLTWKVAQFALGRPLGGQDAAAIEEIHRDAWERGGSYADLMTAIANNDLMRMVRTEPHSTASPSPNEESK